MKRCIHLSRFEAEDASAYGDFALVSIRDFVAPAPALRPGQWRDVIELRFDDIRCSDEAVTFFQGTHKVPPMPKDAAAILGFVRAHFDDNIAVHCEQGEGRSAAVCWFLAQNGWLYERGEHGLKNANQRLLDLLHRQLAQTGPLGAAVP